MAFPAHEVFVFTLGKAVVFKVEAAAVQIYSVKNGAADILVWVFGYLKLVRTPVACPDKISSLNVIIGKIRQTDGIPRLPVIKRVGKAACINAYAPDSIYKVKDACGNAAHSRFGHTCHIPQSIDMYFLFHSRHLRTLIYYNYTLQSKKIYIVTYDKYGILFVVFF